MTYDDQAIIFQKALAETGSVAESLRLTFRAAYPGRRKLTDEQIADLRRRRGAGEKLDPLALDFGISVAHVFNLCRGVRKPLPPRRALAPAALDVVRVVGTQLFELESGWERRHLRGKPKGHAQVALAQRAALLAMRALGLKTQQIADVLGKQPWSVLRTVAHAEDDADARQIAAVVAEILAREATPITAPAPAVAQHRAA